MSHGPTQTQAGSTVSGPLAGISQASADRAAAAGGAGPGQGNLSRQPSTTASGNSTPARQSLDIPRGASYTLPHRPSISRDHSYTSQATTTTTASSTAAHAGTPLPLSPARDVTTQHYIDTAAYRTEMEHVKAENEALRQRVRTLERALRARRRDSSTSDVSRPEQTNSGTLRNPRDREPSSALTSPTLSSHDVRTGLSPAGVAAWAAADGGVGGVAPPRERSESQSTTASSSRRGTQVEDDVRLGESAGSAGMARNL
jgi:hypothetical protein